LPSLNWGEKNHDALADQAEPITDDEVEQSLRAGTRLAICEWPLEGRFNGVQIRGQTDFLSFEGKKAFLLLDFKFSTARRPFRDHEVQAEIYSLLTELMDFSAEELCFGVVIFPPNEIAIDLQDAELTRTAALRTFTKNGTLHDIYERCEHAREGLLIEGK